MTKSTGDPEIFGCQSENVEDNHVQNINQCATMVKFSLNKTELSSICSYVHYAFSHFLLPRGVIVDMK